LINDVIVSITSHLHRSSHITALLTQIKAIRSERIGLLFIWIIRNVYVITYATGQWGKNY